MSELHDVMDMLAVELPHAREVSEFQDLEDVIYALEDTLGPGVHLLSLDDGGADGLPPHQRRLFEAIVYIQGTWHLLSDIAFDGFYSVFYNDTGAQIDLCRAALKRSDAELSDLFEQAYALLAPQLGIVPEDNVVTRRQGESPYDLVDRDTLMRIEQMENAIEARRMEIFERAIALYRNARQDG